MRRTSRMLHCPKEVAMRGRTLIAGAIVLGATAACANEGDKQVLQPVVLGMTQATGATYNDGQVSMYQVEKPVELPIRAPNDGERPSGDVDPYPHAPYY